MIDKHAAHRLQVVEMAWTDDSTLAIFFYMRYSTTGSLHRAKSYSLESSDQHRHHESGNQALTDCHVMISF